MYGIRLLEGEAQDFRGGLLSRGRARALTKLIAQGAERVLDQSLGMDGELTSTLSSLEALYPRPCTSRFGGYRSQTKKSSARIGSQSASLRERREFASEASVVGLRHHATCINVHQCRQADEKCMKERHVPVNNNERESGNNIYNTYE